MILARKIVTLSKAQMDGRSVAFGIPYRFYVGTHNENHAFIEQKRVFDSLGEDLGCRWVTQVPKPAATILFAENVVLALASLFRLRSPGRHPKNAPNADAQTLCESLANIRPSPGHGGRVLFSVGCGRAVPVS